MTVAVEVLVTHVNMLGTVGVHLPYGTDALVINEGVAVELVVGGSR